MATVAVEDSMTDRRRVIAGGGAVLAGLVVVAILAVGLGVVRVGSGGPAAAAGPPQFVEESVAAGLVQTYDGGPDDATGGGVAVFDCDGDGRPDVYVAGGEGPAALFHDDSPVGGALRFSRRADPVTDLPDVTGAYPIDIDGDGNVDLAVLRLGHSTLLRGLGGCRFAPADATWSFTGGDGFATAFSATWEGSNTLPTLALGRYLTLDATGAATLDCADDSLFRPASPGGSVYGAAIPLAPGFCALSMLFSDWSRTGQRDLRITNDAHYYDPTVGEDQLWRIPTGGTPRLYTAADGWTTLQIEGMGIASQDVTGDGYPDIFLTSQADNKLQTLTSGAARPAYTDIGGTRGVTAAQPFTGGDVLPSTAWHPEFVDVNDDGYMDLFISKGNVDAQPDFAAKDPSNLFLGQPDGTFVEAADRAGILDYDRGRGAALADFNLDGLPDLIEVHFGAPVKLWRNVGAGDATTPAPMGHWLELAVTEPGPNRNAIGGWLDVRVGERTTTTELTIGGGHISGELGWLHAGLGTATTADVRIEWPDGEIGPWMSVSADRFSTIERGATSAQVWPLPVTP
jgi:enediyne biosynthesis protein E4